MEEEAVLQNLFEKYKSKYIIRRRGVEWNDATAIDLMK